MDNVAQKTLRLLLRSIPVVPGPELVDLVAAVQKSRTSIEAKVEKAVVAVEEAVALFDEVEATLKERSSKLDQLRAEVQRYSELAAVEEGKAAALIKQIETSLSRGRNTERVVSFGINVVAGLIFFVLGAWLGPKLTGYFQRESVSAPSATSVPPVEPSTGPPATTPPATSEAAPVPARRPAVK